MKVNKYSSWRQTNIALHMLLQMMGKTKLDKMAPQPEWNQSLLYPTPKGFTTGLVPDTVGSFEVRLDLVAKRVEARCICGTQAGFALADGSSVSDYYDQYLAMLDYVGHPCSINSAPQEVFFDTPFEKQTDPVDFDSERAWEYFETCVFAHNALLAFSSAYRGKKIQPSLFWGTFDMTTVLFAGVDMPFSGKGKIEQVAFDEVFVEFGFWPGDEKLDDPSFFALPYPYVETPPPGKTKMPEGARFAPEKKEYIYPLQDALRSSNPQQAVVEFCDAAFEALSTANKWPHLEWYTKPLLV